MPSSDEGQEESEQGVFCGAHLPEEAPPFGRGASLDIWTIENVETLLKDIWTINPNLKAVSLLNRADVQGSDNADTIEILSGLAGIAYSGVTLVNRKAYGRAVAQGLAIPELKQRDPKAAHEVLTLFQYVFNSQTE